MEYKIIYADVYGRGDKACIEKLEKDVSEMLADGWELHGAPFIRHGSHSGALWCQALVKPNLATCCMGGNVEE